MNKKGVFIFSFLVYILTAYFSYSFFSKERGRYSVKRVLDYSPPKLSKKVVVENNKEPKTEPCPLNGERHTLSQRQKWEKRRPLGIMVENHVNARPQSGLSSADIIYEAVAEGGITRFLAIFYCKDAPYVGPVRSARIYFIKLLRGYGRYPLYAHVGGANTPGPADALGKIRTLGWSSYNDLNQFSVPFPNFWRDYERLPGRVTEHTVYTSTIKLWQFAKEKRHLTDTDKKGEKWSKGFNQWAFFDDNPVDEGSQVDKISFSFWSRYDSDNYGVVWRYDRKSNSYRRENGGKPHLDKNTGKQLRAKNVIVLFARERPANDGYPGGHLLYDIVGGNKLLIFQNGTVIEGEWKKEDEESRLEFFDKRGKELGIVRGPVFIEILPLGNKVSY